MSIQNDVLVVLAFVSEGLHSVADEASPMYSVPMRERAKELDAARAAVAELIEAAEEKLAALSPDGIGHYRLRDALARCRGESA